MCTSCEEKRRRMREDALKRREQYLKTLWDRKAWIIVEPEWKVWQWRWDMCKNCWQYNFYCVCKKIWLK